MEHELTVPSRTALFHDQLWPMLERLLIQKAGEYGSPVDAHANYRQVEKVMKIPTTEVILARAVEKLARLSVLLRSTLSTERQAEEVADAIGVLCVLWAELKRRG